MAVVFIPPQMRTLTGGVAEVTVAGATLRQVIRNLDTAYPGLAARLVDGKDNLLPGLAVAIDGVTNHMGMLEPVRKDSEVHFIPAIGGG